MGRRPDQRYPPTKTLVNNYVQPQSVPESILSDTLRTKQSFVGYGVYMKLNA
ncbi:MAG: hypothetical protein WBA23_25490 [Tunicatimonas sp.]|uniref:hypothetical protein n=1 Tax=Tunicatimonas sp. TaxID=1940096 RepID=UPI003C767C81